MNKRFFKNTFWIVGGKIIQQGIGFVVSILTASYLGPSNFGILGYVSSITILFTAFANLGLSNIIVKEIIANKGNEGKVVGTAMFMQLISSITAYVLVILTVYILNINDSIMLMCAVLQGLGLIMAVSDNLAYYYQSKLESKIPTIATLVAYIMLQVYKVILLVLKKPVTWFAFANTLDFAMVAVVLFITYKIQKNPKLSFSKNIAKSLLKQSFPFIIAGTVSVLYASLDKIMLKELLYNTEVVGYYNVAHTISNIWVFVVGACITSFSPIIYEAEHIYGIDNIQYKIRIRQMYFVVFWLGCVASICVDLLVPWLIPWAYGGKYDLSIVPSMILTWASIFSYLGVARGIQFVCENKQKYIVFFAALTVVVNVIMNIVMIPRFQVIGASIATLISELFVCIIALFILKPTRNIAIDIICGIIGKGVQAKEIIQIVKNKFKRKKQSNNIESVSINSDNDKDITLDNPAINQIIDSDNVQSNTNQKLDTKVDYNKEKFNVDYSEKDDLDN